MNDTTTALLDERAARIRRDLERVVADFQANEARIRQLAARAASLEALALARTQGHGRRARTPRPRPIRGRRSSGASRDGPSGDDDDGDGPRRLGHLFESPDDMLRQLFPVAWAKYGKGAG